MSKTNPMREHFERVSAIQKAKREVEQAALASKFQRQRIGAPAPKPANEDVGIPSDTADQAELRLFADMQRIKAIQSLTAKRALKAELLPKYIPWIEGTLTISPAPQNNMLLHLMVWALDAGSYDLATQIAEHALLNEMAMPDPFTRDVATVFAEQLADGILEDAITAPNYSDILEHAVELIKPHDIVDQVRAKLYKAYGTSIEAQRPKEAVSVYEIALRLDKSVGVKKMIEVLNRTIKRGDTESAPDTLSGSQNEGSTSAETIDPASTAQLFPVQTEVSTTEQTSIVQTTTEENSAEQTATTPANPT